MTSAPIRADTSVERTFSLEGGLSASTALGFGIAVVAEGLAFHVWFASRSQIVAWLITALNVASLVYMWRAYVASQRAALRITATEVVFDVAQVRWRFPRSAIESVEPATWRSVPDLPTGFFNSAKPLDPNVLIILRQPMIMRIPFGMTRQVTRVTLRVQDPEGVMAALRQTL